MQNKNKLRVLLLLFISFLFFLGACGGDDSATDTSATDKDTTTDEQFEEGKDQEPEEEPEEVTLKYASPWG